ncbi:TPR domain protein [Minicystis rosea]|nr:TPR domain protein [Minicystis rosea]
MAPAPRHDDTVSEAEIRARIKADPLDVDAYRKLHRLELERGAHDEAWCAAAALAFLRKADQEETRFFENHRPSSIPAVRGGLDEEQWRRNLFHEEDSIHIGRIFEMIAPATLHAKMDVLKARNELPVLDERFREDPNTSKVGLARIFGWSAAVLGIARPPFYLRDDLPGALVHVPVDPPASVAGNTLLTGFSPRQMLFPVGKHLAMHRPEHYIKTLFATVAELTALLHAGIALVAPGAPFPPELDQQIVAVNAMLRRYIKPLQIEGLRDAVRRFFAEGARVDMARWSHAVEITSARAGLLLCGDLEIAKQILAAERDQPDDLSLTEKLKELLVFWVSPQHHALRQALGITIASTVSSTHESHHPPR